jgi:uncharacterized protein YbaP (TraB family)
MSTRRPVFRRLAASAVVLAAVTLSSYSPAAQAGKGRAFFWKATSPTTEVYLLGSIHAAKKETFPLPPEIDAAFVAASTLVVELDAGAINQLQVAALVLKKAMYPAGDSLEKHVAPETMTALKDYMKKNELPESLMTALSKTKPGMASAMLTVMVAEKLGMSPDFGIDKHFTDRAHQPDAPGGAKRIVELETMEEQLNLLLDVEDKLAERQLLASLKETNKDALDRLLQAWMRGDTAAVERMMIDPAADEASKKYNDRMLGDRNDRMTEKIAALLKGKERVFVVVGAAHLVGDRSIIKQLEGLGHKIERPEISLRAKTP